MLFFVITFMVRGWASRDSTDNRRPSSKSNDRLILQLASDSVETGLGVADIARTGRLKLGLDIGSENLVQGCHEVKEADPPAGSDVVDGSVKRLRIVAWRRGLRPRHWRRT